LVKFITGKKNRLNNSEETLFIPRYQAALRFIEFPSTDPSEIKGMAELYALRQSPCTKEEIIMGFRNIGSFKKGFSFVMLAIVKRQQAEEMIRHRAVIPGSIRLETELLYSNLLKKSLIEKDRTVLVMYIQESHSEIMVIDGIRPVFSRGFNGRETPADEINRSLIAYGSGKNNKKIEKTVIVHSPDVDMGKVRSGFEMLSSMPLDFYEDKGDTIDSGAHLEINLLPREYIDKRANKESMKQAFVTYSLLFIAMTMLTSLFIFELNEKNKTILMFSKEAEKAEKDITRIDNILKKTKALKYMEEEGMRVTGILKEYLRLVPQDVLMEELNYEDNGVFYCNGVSRDITGIFNFVKVLERSGYFKKVEIKYAAKKQIGNREYTDFSIGCFAH
jgi:Tfp pilus assembly protein PilN